MNKFYTLLVVCFLALTSMVRAEEQVTVTVSGPEAKAIVAAEQARVSRMEAAAERAGMSFWEARKADAGKVWNGTKWTSCQVARGITSADGYMASAVAVPSGYVAGAAFTAAESCASSAASIK